MGQDRLVQKVVVSTYHWFASRTIECHIRGQIDRWWAVAWTEVCTPHLKLRQTWAISQVVGE